MKRIMRTNSNYESSWASPYDGKLSGVNSLSWKNNLVLSCSNFFYYDGPWCLDLSMSWSSGIDRSRPWNFNE